MKKKRKKILILMMKRKKRKTMKRRMKMIPQAEGVKSEREKTWMLVMEMMKNNLIF